MCFFIVQALLGQIRAFVAKLMTSRIRAFWAFFGLDYVAFTRFCCESGFFANTRSFGFVLSRLLLIHWRFYSAQKIGCWHLWLRVKTQHLTPSATSQQQNCCWRGILLRRVVIGTMTGTTIAVRQSSEMILCTA